MCYTIRACRLCGKTAIVIRGNTATCIFDQRRVRPRIATPICGKPPLVSLRSVTSFPPLPSSTILWFRFPLHTCFLPLPICTWWLAVLCVEYYFVLCFWFICALHTSFVFWVVFCGFVFVLLDFILHYLDYLHQHTQVSINIQN
jgi:hypothetical protein